MDSFRKLGIPEPILKALSEEHFKEPTEIQVKAIPLAVANHDIIAGSATGSGKTLAFSVPIIKNIEPGRGIQALILTPTRELAVQITHAMRKFSKYKKMNIVEVYGGVSMEPQVNNLRRADVVVATPGRLLDHMRRHTIDMFHIKILVIDEADRMFDMGFIKDVKMIIGQCPPKRQTLLFSATISREVSFLSKKYMNNPKQISGETYVDPRKLKQEYYDVDEKMKISLLVHLLKKEHSGLVMVFCNTKHEVNFVAENLKANGIDAHGMHGGFTQAKRSSTLAAFHTKDVKVLICTDVAARGLDIKGVSHVYNYDIPKEAKQYIHRIGRTARAGENGIAINLLSRDQHSDFSKLLRFYDLNVYKHPTPQVEMIRVVHERRPRFNRNFSRRRY